MARDNRHFGIPPARREEIDRWATRQEWVSGILIVLALCVIGWAFVGPMP